MAALKAAGCERIYREKAREDGGTGLNSIDCSDDADLGAFAEYERAMLRERTKADLDSARLIGRIGGRRPKLSPQQQAEITKLVSKGHKTAADAARLFKVHPATVSRLLARAYAEQRAKFYARYFAK